MISRKFLTLLLIVMSGHQNVYSARTSDFHLIVGLSFEDHYSDQATASWERGSEILPGAHIAVESINNREDILPGHKLHATAVNIGRCGDQNYNFLLHFINTTYHQDINLIGAVGIFCPTEMNIAQPIEDSHKQKSVRKENLKMVVKAVDSVENGRFLNSYPRSLMIKALLEFFNTLNWKKIAVIKEAKDTFYISNFVESLHGVSVERSSNQTVAVFNYAPDNIIHQNLPRIVLVSVSLPLAVELLCSAYREGLMWPKHVWIIHTFFYETVANLNASCDVEIALENVLFFSEELPMADNVNYSEKYASIMSQHSNMNVIETNFYSLILHDLVWSVALAVNETFQGQIEASSNMETLQQRKISIIQVQNRTKIQIATYSQSDDLNFTNLTFRLTVPSDELRISMVGVSVTYTATFLTEIIVGFIFVTVMLIGYSCFRNEPEVKSTSFSLSLLVFLGCYLMFVYLSILLYFHQPWSTSDETLDGLCISLNWFSGLGIPNALILATALVKILRIYHIFSKRTPSSLSSKCSDSYLALYVLLIILPLILVHTLWTNLDPYVGFFKVSTQLNDIQYEKQCASNYTMLWYALLAGYLLTIFVILFVVAIKMRNIQISHFNDTKKVTILVICYFIDLVVGLTCWRIIYTAVNAYYAAIVLHIGHIIVIVLCQVLLFAPKVLPPFTRYLKKL